MRSYTLTAARRLQAPMARRRGRRRGGRCAFAGGTVDVEGGEAAQRGPVVVLGRGCAGVLCRRREGRFVSYMRGRLHKGNICYRTEWESPGRRAEV